MKTFRLAFAAAALAVLAPPAPAQQTSLTNPSYDFLKAVKERDGNKVMQLLDTGAGNLINTKEAGETPLNIVVGRHDETWTSFFLGRGADPNGAGKGGDTPLIVAARVGFADGVDQLLKAGARVDTPNKMGETALIVAVQQRATDVVKALLAAGANPDKTDTAAGLSARQYAARDNRSRDILTLIESQPKKGAKIEKVEKVDDFKLR
ncbi:MAG: ankyrin repeat domain-containing protein [Sphingomicrobium sp.]